MRTWSPGAPHFDFVRLRGWRFVTRDGPIPSLQPPPTTCVCVSVVSAWGQGPWGALAPWGWPRCGVCVCVCVLCLCVCVCVCVCVFVCPPPRHALARAWFYLYSLVGPPCPFFSQSPRFLLSVTITYSCDGRPSFSLSSFSQPLIPTESN
jgi:hypothetical protein